MALDGAFLRFIKNELKNSLLGSRVDKIFQPNKHEFIFCFRGKTGSTKLLISTRATSARVNITQSLPENPATPFMLCMLFRKKLLGAKLISVTQKNLERALALHFEATNELGDKTELTLVAEIMGQHSNIILVDQNNKIVDAIKRVDETTSSKRQVLPGLAYRLPPSQNKICILNCNIEKIAYKIYDQFHKNNKPLYQILLENLQGLSTIVCKEIEYNVLKNQKNLILENLTGQLTKLKASVSNYSGQPTIIINENNQFLDFTFFIPEHCHAPLKISHKSNFSELLETFFYERDKSERIQNNSQNFIKILKNEDAKLKRKIKIQRQELTKAKARNDFKIFADLIAANAYKIKNGAKKISVENFYDPALKKIEINLDPSLNAHQNAQKYYKKYSKLKNAEIKLTEEIEKATTEIQYIDTVLDEINRAETLTELDEIKNELASQGYIKKKKNTKKTAKAAEPLKFMSSSGFTILVGKNNAQNDKLTLKIAPKNDIWLHVKDYPGSHVVTCTNGQTVDEPTILEAAKLAALHSKCKCSNNVAVDFTLVKHVKKHPGAKPGMVTYTNYQTIFVNPEG